MPGRKKPAHELTPEQLEHRRKRDRIDSAKRRAGLAAVKDKAPVAHGDGVRRVDHGGPCAACFSTGCTGFVGDLLDTYDRADCPHCQGTGTIAATRERADR